MASGSSPGVDDTAARLIVTPLVGVAPDLPVHDSVHELRIVVVGGALPGSECDLASIAMAVITIVAAVTFITHVYETLADELALLDQFLSLGRFDMPTA